MFWLYASECPPTSECPASVSLLSLGTNAFMYIPVGVHWYFLVCGHYIEIISEILPNVIMKLSIEVSVIQ